MIDKLPSLSLDQKEEIKNFFLKHPNYENKIDWNRKDLIYNDFAHVLALDGKSKNQARKKGLEGLVEGKDYMDFGKTEIEYLGLCHLYMPLTHLGSVTLASNKVPPVKENGAKWCISQQKTNKYWEQYTSSGIKFLFVFTEDTKYAITLYDSSVPYNGGRKDVFSFEDNNMGWPSWCKNSSYINECIKQIKSIFPDGPEYYLQGCIKKGLLVKNTDGTYDKKDYKAEVSSHRLISNGKFICKFNEWKGDFDCHWANLISLEGSPRIVRGNFSCILNKDLTSLKGAPETIIRNFDCSGCGLTSLVGGLK